MRELHHCMYYIHTWCASRTAYLITNGPYLNGHSHSHIKSKPNSTKPNQTNQNQTKPTKPNQTNQTKNKKKAAAPICLFTKTKTQKAAVAGWLSYARRRLWRLVPQSGVGANRRNHLGAWHGADGPPPAGRRPGVPGNPADTGGRPGGSLGPQNEV